jgi:hypothetical protein
VGQIPPQPSPLKPSPSGQFALLVRAARLGSVRADMRTHPVIHPRASFFRQARALTSGGPAVRALPSHNRNTYAEFSVGDEIWIPRQSAELLA